MFEDRKDAGIKLGEALLKYKSDRPLILGIPRGGIETAHFVARVLDAEMIPVITRKLGYPNNPELAMGALAEDGSYYLTDFAINSLNTIDLNSVLEREKQEIRRRVKLLRGGKELPSFRGRTLVLVDDGIATGATIFATVELCRKKKPKKIIVAAPISGQEAFLHLQELADEVLILSKPQDFRAVSQGYRRFSNLSDDETLAFLEKPKPARIIY